MQKMPVQMPFTRLHQEWALLTMQQQPASSCPLRCLSLELLTASLMVSGPALFLLALQTLTAPLSFCALLVWDQLPEPPSSVSSCCCCCTLGRSLGNTTGVTDIFIVIITWQHHLALGAAVAVCSSWHPQLHQLQCCVETMYVCFRPFSVLHAWTFLYLLMVHYGMQVTDQRAVYCFLGVEPW